MTKFIIVNVAMLFWKTTTSDVIGRKGGSQIPRYKLGCRGRFVEYIKSNLSICQGSNVVLEAKGVRVSQIP